jgi:uncharacterized membrane protein YsdA (DUF1294 family)/cold shock CspA family protein
MAQQGELIEWNDARGFGFIRPDDGSPRLFVHISQIGRIATRPRVGDRVSFSIGSGRDGRVAAALVTIAGPLPPKRWAPARGVSTVARRHQPVRVYVGSVLLAMLLFGWLAGSIPPILVLVYLVLGLASVGLYAVDKESAQAGAWRISEGTLHALDLAFGIVGGLLAQEMVRHKTAKPDFAAMTYIIAAVHGIWLAAIVSGRISLDALAALIPG